MENLLIELKNGYRFKNYEVKRMKKEIKDSDEWIRVGGYYHGSHLYFDSVTSMSEEEYDNYQKNGGLWDYTPREDVLKLIS